MNKPNILSKLTTLKQVEESQELREAIDRDFGSAIEDLNDGVSRRRWLQLMGASLALGGMSGCRYEQEQFAPFAFRPQNRVPGVPDHYSAMIDFAGVAQPLMAKCYDGRPIKLDGNPDHPAVRGASTSFNQAAILNLYDPDRLRVALKLQESDSNPKNRKYDDATWENVLDAGRKALTEPKSVAIISEQIGSPSLARLKKQLVDKGVSWFTFCSVDDDNTRAGAKMAFGKPLRMHCDLEQARVIVAIDADPIADHPDALNQTIKFTAGRDADHGTMSRLYVVESQYTTTGAAADHRISVPSTRIAGFVGSLSNAIESASPGGTIDAALPYRDKVLACIAQDLVDHAGQSVIMCGEKQPPEVHAAVHALNDRLGNIGKTITFTRLTDEDRPGSISAITSFAEQAKAGEFKSLIILDGNPVFGAAVSLGLAKLIREIENTIHISPYKNETSVCCKLICHVAHQLECWSDGWAYDGSVCIGQPLILPLFDGKSEIEILSQFLGNEVIDGLEIVQETNGLDAGAWAQAVHDGFVSDSQAVAESVSLGDLQPVEANDGWKSKWDESYEIVFNSSRSVYDGRFSNNAWLQELPDFITKLTWGSAACMSPNTAAKLRVRTGQSINIGDVSLPVYIQPGQADGSIGLTLGYGRTHAGRVGGNIHQGDVVGVNVNPLRTTERWHFGTVGAPTPTAKFERLAMVQEPWDIDETGRNEIQSRMFRNRDSKEGDRSSLIREGTLESYLEFLARNEHGHAGHHDAEPKHDEHSSTERSRNSLPILNNVSFVSPAKMEAGYGEDDSHGEHHHWPEAFHLHHQPFDITPGARLDYTVQNPEHYNMWGMGIDLTKCTGCNACVIACQSENNIPVVGADQVRRGREMHWIRIDRYYGRNLFNKEAAESDDRQIVHQPVACQQCENAPCETVCPVAATVHSREGLNDMVYNRCIGTRYCGNNCPYKVRRFNYLNYSDAVTFLKYPGADKLSKNDRSVENLLMNPEVTIRSRGVMEKCTYCVQRIQNTKIQAKTEGNRPIGPNEIRTACQDACPTRAITFGDLNNLITFEGSNRLQSDVRRAHDNPRSYTLLEELNNYPRTKYLARVSNPHPALVDHDDRNSVRGFNAKRNG